MEVSGSSRAGICVGVSMSVESGGGSIMRRRGSHSRRQNVRDT